MGNKALAFHGDFYERVKNGNCYYMPVKSFTVTATTDISPLPGTTGRALLGIYNPPTSKKDLVVLQIRIATVSGTPGGPFYIDTLAGAACTPTNASKPINAYTHVAAGSVTFAYAAAVPVSGAVSVMLRPLGGPAAIAAGAGMYDVNDLVDGKIVVPPGALLAVTAHATGTSHVGSGFIMWEEVDE